MTFSETNSNVLSVSGLNRMARSLLEDAFPLVTVEGEISNMAMPASGHWYLTLKDERAQIRCAMFRNRNRSVRLRPVNGMQVTVRGRLSLYEARGDYQLILDSMQEAGAGALQRAFEQLKAKLADEGLFAPAGKKALPRLCRHVGIITSPTGAALQDMLTVFARRFPAMRITVFPVAVQGDDAAAAIVGALETANRRRGELRIDALILGRGGGSLEDLQAFNEENVARAVAGSELPIVCGVGHETDFSICDFVADMRAPTPSAAAELLSPDQAAYLRRLDSCHQQLTRNMQQHLALQRQRMLGLVRRLRHPGRRLQEQAQWLDGLEMRLRRAVNERLNAAGHRVGRLHSHLLLVSPVNTLHQYRLRNVNLRQRLQQAGRRLLKDRKARLHQLSHALDSVSPLQTLKRGYSITRDEDDNVLRDSAAVTTGSRITTRLADGELISVVEEHKP